MPSGQSLARVPDDADLGSNALDFRAAEPSPGTPNQSAVDLAPLRGQAQALPERPAVGEAWRASASIVARGAQPVAAGTALLTLRDAEAGDTLASARLEPGMRPGDTLAVTLEVAGLPAGKRTLVFEAWAPGDERRDDADTLRVRIGPGPLEITEIQFHPAAGEGEWIEIANRSALPLALDGFRLADRAGAPRAPARGVVLAPESLAVFVQDRAALTRHFALDTTRVLAVAPWPSLNNSDGDDGIADAVVVREADGTLVDRVEYSARGVPAGVPIERQEGGVWAPSPSLMGSPLVAATPPAPADGGFEAGPKRLDPGAVLTLRWTLPWSRARVQARAFDLAGRDRGLLMAETLAPGRAERRLAAPVAPGVYLVVLSARPERGDESVARTRVIRVGAAR